MTSSQTMADNRTLDQLFSAGILNLEHPQSAEH
jgi:hypothetical protein